MYRRKSYGESRIDTCAFCGSRATTKNKQGQLVCRMHKDQVMEDIRCTCGSWLENKSGKWGPYYNCINCGNISFDKAMEMKEINARKKAEQISSEPKINNAIKKDNYKTNPEKKQQIKARVEKEKEKFILDGGNYPGFDYGL